MTQLRNMPLYINILAAIATNAKTTNEISAQVETGWNAVNAALQLMRGRLVHIERYAPSVKGVPSAVWKLGRMDDADPPPSMVGRDYGRKPKSRTEIVAFIEIIDALMNDHCSIKELIELSGSGVGTVRRLMRDGKKLGVLHVAAWHRAGESGDFAPMWAVGINKRDAAKPKAQTDAEACHRYWVRRSQKRHQLRITHALAANNSVFNMAV